MNPLISLFVKIVKVPVVSVISLVIAATAVVLHVLGCAVDLVFGTGSHVASTVDQLFRDVAIELAEAKHEIRKAMANVKR